MQVIYLDYNATTPLDPAVVTAMQPFLVDGFGNPSSGHEYGQQAHRAVDAARVEVAQLLSAQPDEILFTSGGTEANNHALKGTVFARLQGFFGRWFGRGSRDHLVISAVEHPATLQPARFLERLGCKVTIVPVDGQGLVNPDDVARALRHGATLVSIMHSNNEVGTLQPLADIAKLCRAAGVLCHTDAAQSLGKVPVDVQALGVDLLSVAGHKLYAPKGVGALYIRRGVTLEPLLHGAGHEGGRRASTEAVPNVVALGTACRVAREGLPLATERLRALRDRLHDRLKELLGDRIVLNGHPQCRLPNTLNVNVRGAVGADLLKAVPGVAASTGSACHEGHISQSPVLCAMGVPPELGQGAIRLTVGRFTTDQDVDEAANRLAQGANRLGKTLAAAE